MPPKSPSSGSRRNIDSSTVFSFLVESKQHAILHDNIMPTKKHAVAPMGHRADQTTHARIICADDTFAMQCSAGAAGHDEVAIDANILSRHPFSMMSLADDAHAMMARLANQHALSRQAAWNEEAPSFLAGGFTAASSSLLMPRDRRKSFRRRPPRPS